MKKSTLTLSIVVLCLSVFVATDEARAVSVGWNFSFQGSEDLTAAEVAGAPGFAQANWNNHSGAGQAPGATPLNNLTGDDGGAAVATTVDVVAWSQSSNNSWHYNDHTGPDNRLLDGFADQQPSLTFADLGPEFTTPGYSVVVYYGNNEGPDDSDLSVTGLGDDFALQVVRTGPTASASFASVGYVEETGALSGSTNYTVFSGLDDPGFTVDMISITQNNNNGIAAIQIIANAPVIPEPGTFGLLVFGALGLACCARRRRRSRA